MTKAFVVGHPIKHSRSPLIHGYWLRQHGLAGSYERLDVPPSEFGPFLLSLEQQGFVGGNVTIPHKEAAYAGVARRTERAERLKAVNTLWIEDGVLWGDNTDMIGFMAHLDQSLGAGWERDIRHALVIGAGGAARAVLAGLQERALDCVTVVNRTQHNARQLVQDLDRPGGRLRTANWDRLLAIAAEVELIVNTTPLGMAGHRPLEIDLTRVSSQAVVADIVYVPLKTPLLAAAEEKGLRTVDGLGMLLHQAVPGFARWFGVTPEVTPELRNLVVADIKKAR